MGNRRTKWATGTSWAKPPKAIIALRQGAGRLIRSQRDFGVIVLLDRRVADKPYGRKFLRSLPPMNGTRRVEDIAPFLATHAARTAP